METTECVETSASPLCKKNCGSTQTFESTAEQDYYVLVHGQTSHLVGKAKIAVWDYPPIDYDTCEDSARLTINGSVPFIGSTKYAEPDTVVCGAATVEGLGTWHLFTGTGKTTTISTDYEQTDFESEILVVEACSNAGKCITNIDAGMFPDSPLTNAYGSVFTFDAKKDQRYRVMVYGTSRTGSGSYGLTVKDFQPPANDVCKNAVSLTGDGQAVQGSTIYATVEALTCPNTGAVIEGRGVWYTFRGTGSTMVVSTCYAETNHPAELYVFAGCGGDCSVPIEPGEEFECDSGFGKLIAVETLFNQFYFVLVAGSNNSKVGKHKISVVKYGVPENDECENAINLVTGQPPIVGSTAGATSEASCIGGVADKGVWCEYLLSE